MAFACHLHVLNDGPPTSLVIVQVHQLSAMVVSAASHAHLSFSDVNEILGKLVAVMDVISTTSPYPFLLEIFGATSLGTSAGCKLAVAAASGDAVHDPSGSYGISESSLFRWDRQDGTENGRVFNCRTIPFVMSELKLAFGDAVPGSAANVHHVVSVEHTQLFLTTGKPRDLVTNPGC